MWNMFIINKKKNDTRVNGRKKLNVYTPTLTIKNLT